MLPKHLFSSTSKRLEFIVFVVIVFCGVIQALPALAIDCSIQIDPGWKNHFPFDLIYPIAPAGQPASGCPTINFWGKDREVCSIPQVTAIVKNLILARVAIRGLFQL